MGYSIDKFTLLEENPRSITEIEIQELRESLTKDTWMLDYRGIIVDEQFTILGGNQRFRVLTEFMGFTEIPEEWVTVIEGLTEDQKREIVVIDNAHAGSWDFDALKGLDEDTKLVFAEAGVPILIGEDDIDEDGMVAPKQKTPKPKDPNRKVLAQIKVSQELQEPLIAKIALAKKKGFDFVTAIESIYADNY
jgi:hypothetical protein